MDFYAPIAVKRDSILEIFYVLIHKSNMKSLERSLNQIVLDEQQAEDLLFKTNWDEEETFIIGKDGHEIARSTYVLKLWKIIKGIKYSEDPRVFMELKEIINTRNLEVISKHFISLRRYNEMATVIAEKPYVISFDFGACLFIIDSYINWKIIIEFISMFEITPNNTMKEAVEYNAISDMFEKILRKNRNFEVPRKTQMRKFAAVHHLGLLIDNLSEKSAIEDEDKKKYISAIATNKYHRFCAKFIAQCITIDEHVVGSQTMVNCDLFDFFIQIFKELEWHSKEAFKELYEDEDDRNYKHPSYEGKYVRYQNRQVKSLLKK